ncbi:hypothetical protein ACH5RR_013156 [Cinchona calisaya]|uniref:Uncharacterized protein n=1 Tax=Cinchona calisaya TaxID=153742 RepID=A0ABD2ZZA8_9GENT
MFDVVKIENWYERDAFSIEAILQLTFVIADEADEFYNLYARQELETRAVYCKGIRSKCAKDLSEIAMYRSLNSMCKEICQFGSKVNNGYDHVVKVVQGEIDCLKEKYKEVGEGDHIEPWLSILAEGNMMDIIKGHAWIDKKKGQKLLATHMNSLGKDHWEHSTEFNFN